MTVTSVCRLSGFLNFDYKLLWTFTGAMLWHVNCLWCFFNINFLVFLSVFLFATNSVNLVIVTTEPLVKRTEKTDGDDFQILVGNRLN